MVHWQMSDNQFWAGRVLVDSLCQFLWCKFSLLSQFQATYMMLTKLSNSCKFSNELLQVCSSLVWHTTACAPYMYVALSSLVAYGTACLGMLLLLPAGVRVPDIFPYLPLHLPFSLSPLHFLSLFKLLTFSLLHLWVLILHVPSSPEEWR